jgi:hypothetical protein
LENARFFIANVFVEMLRTNKVHEASTLSYLLGNAPCAVRSRIWMKQQFYEEKG